jgi:Subtilase family
VCGNSVGKALLAEANWYPYWDRKDGACPACVRQTSCKLYWPKATRPYMRRSRRHGRWMPRPPSEFCRPASACTPIPDSPAKDNHRAGGCWLLSASRSNRAAESICVWADATHDSVSAIHFEPDETPKWPDWDGAHDWQWHGTMTSTVAAGNGFLSHGLYSGLAHEAELVLIQVRDSSEHISSASIHRALVWILKHSPELRIRIVSLSVSGDPVSPLAGNDVDEAVSALVEAGISVVGCCRK